MIKAVIFDLDNTLVDFMAMKARAIGAAIHAMRDAGFQLSYIVGTPASRPDIRAIKTNAPWPSAHGICTYETPVAGFQLSHVVAGTV